MTHGFGAVKLISAAGMNFAPGPSFGGPLWISHELGASTLSTGTKADSICETIEPNGSRNGPPKEKPKIASTRKSVDLRADEKSVMKGTERFCSWVLRRW